MNPLVLILIIILFCGGVGTYPGWQHSQGWSYYPSGGLGLVLLVLVILTLTGKI